MSAVLYPSSMICTINRPLDEKTNVLTITERNAIPMAQRYKGMVLIVQNAGATRPQICWLPTDDLSNNNWEEIEPGSSTVLVPDWIAGIKYVVSQVVVHDGVLLRCEVTHTSSDLMETDEACWMVIANQNSSYTHTQETAANTWMIQHNMNKDGKMLRVFATDVTGEQVVGIIDLNMSTKNLLVYKFSEPLAGEAYLN